MWINEVLFKVLLISRVRRNNHCYYNPSRTSSFMSVNSLVFGYYLFYLIYKSNLISNLLYIYSLRHLIASSHTHITLTDTNAWVKAISRNIRIIVSCDLRGEVITRLVLMAMCPNWIKAIISTQYFKMLSTSLSNIF